MRKKSLSLCRFLSLFLSFTILLSAFPLIGFAEGEARTGVVNGTFVNIRSGPSTNDPTLGIQLHTGHAVTVLSEHPDGKGGSIPWYLISFDYGSTKTEGYIRSDFVTLNAPPSVTPPAEPPAVEPNPDFETQLAAFPESYRDAISAIHEQHPSWNFEAFATELDWYAVQNLENRLGWSYINDGILSHYSTAPGSYDWETDTYFVREGSNWYQAHPEMVAYYMDPRNFLNENDLFQFEKLAFSAIQTEENIAAMLRGTFMEGKTTVNLQGETVSYARAFLDASYAANVSAFHLVTRCIQEVGWGGSACVHGSYGGELNGYYNFFNIGAYGGAYDGMVYAKNQGWNTPYKAILAGGSFIGNDYIARGQNTPYYQKYNVVEKNAVASHQYMTNVAAALSEGRIQRAKYSEMGFLEAGFTFSIPVFLNMPEAACKASAAAGSPNNYLKSLSVEGYSLTPSFDFYDTLNNGRTTYDLIISGNVSSLDISAAAVSATATLSGHLGQVPIAAGENLISIRCRAANGLTRCYTVRVILNGEGAPSGPPALDDVPPMEDPEGGASGWNPPYTVQGVYVTGVPAGTDSASFLATLGTYGSAFATLTDESGAAVSGAMRTGMLLNYFDGFSTVQYRIVIRGDVNGDSAIDAIDLLLVRKHLLGLTGFSEPCARAADINRDGAVDAIDLLLVRKALLGLSSISQ